MKRFALLTVLLLVLATLGFADDVLKPGLAFAGGATLSWGIDLDQMTTGFKNETDVTVDLTLVSAFAQEKKGSGDVYGVIKISDFDVTLNLFDVTVIDPPTFTVSGDAAVEAYIVAGALQVGVFDAPGMSLGKAALVEADEDGDYVVVDDEGNVATDVAAYSHGMYGTYVQYTMGPAVLKAVVKSANDWDNNTDNGYAAGLEAVLTFAPVTLGVGAYYGFYAGADIPLVYATAAFKQGMFDISAAFDLALDTAVVWDASLVATLTLKEATTLGLAALIDSNDNLDLKATFTEPAAEGFVPGLGLDLAAWILDAMTELEYLVTADLSYAVGKFTPSVGIDLGNNEAETGGGDDAANDAFFTVSVAVEAALFDNVTLSATWTSGDFMQPDVSPFATGQIGDFVLAANISF